jgi:glycosyltransferase involved in cell wall biosynthesis
MLRDEFDPAYVDEIIQLSSNDGDIMLHSSPWFKREELQYFLNASDVAVLPFAEILTSGSAITALSFGLPVILPSIGCLPELVDENCGLLFDPFDPSALEIAMRRVRDVDTRTARIAALQRAKSLDWNDIAVRFASVYNGG